MDKVEQIKLIVDLTLAKLDILKLKNKDGGYDWSMVGKHDQDLLVKTLGEIDSMLSSFK